MAATEFWHGALTAADADALQAELAEDAAAVGNGIAFRRVEDPAGSFALGWFVTLPPRFPPDLPAEPAPAAESGGAAVSPAPGTPAASEPGEATAPPAGLGGAGPAAQAGAAAALPGTATPAAAGSGPAAAAAAGTPQEAKPGTGGAPDAKAGTGGTEEARPGTGAAPEAKPGIGSPQGLTSASGGPQQPATGVTGAQGATAGHALAGDGQAGRTAAADDPVALAIAQAGTRLGIDPLTLAIFAQIESGLNPRAASSTSTARGLFGITDRTWNDVVTQHGPELGLRPEDRDQLLGQSLAAGELIRESARALARQMQRQASATELYCCHFLGTGAGLAMLRGRPQDPATAPLAAFYAGTRLTADFAQRIRAANRPIFETPGGGERSVAEVLAVLDAKVTRARAAVQPRFATLAAPRAVPQPGVAAGGPGTAAPSGSVPAGTPPDAGLPQWYRIAQAEERAGVAEIPGTRSNPRIEEYFTWTSHGPATDETSWCAAFLAFCLGRAGEVTMGRASARAVDWLSWGQALAAPREGCVVVLRPQARGATGHVGFLVKEEAGMLHLLGGNQSDRVKVSAYPRGELRTNGFRWPT